MTPQVPDGNRIPRKGLRNGRASSSIPRLTPSSAIGSKMIAAFQRMELMDRRLSAVLPTCLRAAATILCVAAFAASARAQALSTNVGTDLGAFSAGEIQFALIATGGSGSYTWDVTAGALPPGIALRTDKPSWFAVNASAGLIGVATVPGHYTFTLRVRS